SGYVGALPPEPENLARTYFERTEVKHLLQALEHGPIARTEAEKMLAGTQTKFADLLRLKLVAVNRGRVTIAFSYFTADDMRLIHSVAAKYVPALVAAYRSRAAELDKILSGYPVASVSRKRLAFVLIAGFSLNWDGLNFLSERGYRKPRQVEGPGWHYSFWASADTPEYSYKGFYWGSSTFPGGAANLVPPLDFSFSSFGDPYSDPRMNFPDLLALQPKDMTPSIRTAAEALGLRDDTALGTTFKNVVGLNRARGFGAMLFAMRNGAQDKARICASLPDGERNACGGMLSLLVAAGYVREEGRGTFALLVPVFDARDKPLVDATLALGREAMTAWLNKNYIPIRRDLSRLTALRQGVPYPALFTQIWHELFGLATRELVADGLIENPNGPGASWKGSIPAVWRTAVYRLDIR
ncbi:MAG: hypothetical protein KGJ75_17775, partial [Alphaproteobacteria bacterium]|nr:hypothetical protein [Alphaproteobacteria bacterium]